MQKTSSSRNWALATGLALVLAATQPGQSQTPTPAWLDGLSGTAAARIVSPGELDDALAEFGRARVIVEFAAPDLPSGVASGSQAGDDFTIAEVRLMQDRILGRVLPSVGLDAAQSEGMPELAMTRMTYSPMFALSADAELLRALAQDPDVVRIHIDRINSFDLTRSLPLIGMPAAITAGGTGQGQMVAILDSGSLINHEFLGSRITQGACFSAEDSTQGIVSICPGGAASATTRESGTDCTNTQVSGCGHGTHVAGTAAGFITSPRTGFPAHGVARNAQIMAVNIGSYSPSQARIVPLTANVIAGLEHVYARRNAHTIAAVNLSLGGGQFSSACPNEPQAPIIRQLTQAGIAVVVAAGNNGFDNAVSSPACVPEAIAVGNTTFNDTRASSSNWGSLVDVAAPGTDILASYINGNSTNTYSELTGTSMAAPHVAGAIAAIRTAVPNATVAQIRAALASTGTPVTAAGRTIPRMNVDRAITELRGGGGGDGVATATRLTGPASSNQGQSVTFTATVTRVSSGSTEFAQLESDLLPLNRAEGPRLTLAQMQAMPDPGEVVVKFREGLRVRLQGGVLTGLDPSDLAALRSMVTGLGVDPEAIRRLISLPEDTLDDMRFQGQAATGQDLADMNNYYVLRVPTGMTAAALADRLNRLPGVEYASPAAVPAPPPFETGAALPETGFANTPNYVSRQGYVGTAPTGIGTQSLGTLAGVNGAGTRVVDIEYSWQMNHEDLLLPASRVVNVGAAAVDPFNDTDHGTAVMGQLVGLNNSFGVTGIVPASFGMVAAANTTRGYNLAQAILAASAAINPGDVILIEQQSWVCGLTGSNDFGPSEWWQEVYDATRAAVANGRVVVAAAGNGNINLDGANCENRFNRSTRDSGAIIVGAGSSTDRSKLSFSSYGNRVDVQGWGHNVTTTGYGDLFSGGGDVRRFYTARFGGTSSASPIVTGAVLAIQGRLRACNRTPLTSVQMRTLLRQTGSAQTGGGGQIGPLPNVPAALTQLGIRTSCGGANDPNPTGTVSFRRGGTQFATGTLNSSGVATAMVSNLPVGSHQITAHYLGTTGFRASTSAALTHAVAGSGGGGPVNDNFANRIIIPAPGSVTGTNVNATAEPGEPAILGSTNRRSVWWSFTPAQSGQLTIDTAGSDFDTILAVFRGNTLTTLQLVAENDDASGLGLLSRVQFQATAGVQYQIAVAGFGAATGNITLNVALQGSGPAATQTTLTGPTSGQAGASLTWRATVSSGSGTPTGTVSFRRDGTEFARATLSGGAASVSSRDLPVATHAITARYLGTTAHAASTSAVRNVTINPVNADFRGGGAVFAQTTECTPHFGPRPLPLSIRYSPSELGGLPSGVSLVWPSGAEHLALWGPMAASGNFFGAAGRASWSRFIFYPTRPLVRVVQRQIVAPDGGTSIALAQELVLRLRVQNFGAIPGCAVTVSATLRRQP